MNLSNRIFVGVVSATLIASASMWEGTKYVPYEDVVGVITVCQGYAGKDVIKGKTYTKDECAYLLKSQLAKHGEAMLKCVNVPLTQYQYDALTLFTYNVGSGAFCASKSVLKPLNEGKYALACKGLLQWTYAGGKYVQGLANRRQYEYKMCMGEMNAK